MALRLPLGLVKICTRIHHVFVRTQVDFIFVMMAQIINQV
jgi:hypothetical protein